MEDRIYEAAYKKSTAKKAMSLRVSETTNELDPLKGLTRLLTLVEMKRKGGENH